MGGFRIGIEGNAIKENESYIRGWAFAYLESTKCYNTKRSMWRSVEDTRRSVASRKTSLEALCGP